MSLSLRPYQTEALDALERAAAEGKRRVLLVLPTGTGKTVVFVELTRRRGGRALILVHRDELVRQAVDKLAMIAPGLNVGVVKAERDEHTAQVVVASVQTLAQSRRLERLVPDQTTVVVDEAHHTLAESYQAILRHVRAFDAPGPFVVGATATPFRGDGRGLIQTFEAIAYDASMLDMIEQGYLCDLDARRIRLAADLDNVTVRLGDFAQGELERTMMQANAPALTAQAYVEHAAGRKALVFTPGVESAHATAKALVARGVAAEAVDGTTPLDERREMLRRFRSGATQVLTNFDVLTEGFDEPAVNCVIMARPTKSKTVYVQALGRGTRSALDKADCLVLDVVGNSRRHSLQSAHTLLGLDVAKRETVRESLMRKRAEAEAQAVDAEQRARLIAERIDLFRKSELHWVRAADGTRFVLQLGNKGTLHVAMDEAAGTWTVAHHTHTNGPRLIARGLTLEYATGVAIDAAKAMNASLHLANPTAAWRREPVTDKQRAALRALRLPVPQTKGEASDLITLHQQPAEGPTGPQVQFLRWRGYAVPKTKREAIALIGRIKAGAA